MCESWQLWTVIGTLSFTLTFHTQHTNGLSLSPSLCSCCFLKYVPFVNLFNSPLKARQILYLLVKVYALAAWSAHESGFG